MSSSQELRPLAPIHAASRFACLRSSSPKLRLKAKESTDTPFPLHQLRDSTGDGGIAGYIKA
jgi:hypothetical protein